MWVPGRSKRLCRSDMSKPAGSHDHNRLPSPDTGISWAREPLPSTPHTGTCLNFFYKNVLIIQILKWKGKKISILSRRRTRLYTEVHPWKCSLHHCLCVTFGNSKMLYTTKNSPLYFRTMRLLVFFIFFLLVRIFNLNSDSRFPN